MGIAFLLLLSGVAFALQPPTIYTGTAKLDGSIAASGTVKVEDSSGNVLRNATIDSSGSYWLTVNWDDANTVEDEGVVSGETITFYVNDVEASSRTVDQSGSYNNLNLSATTGEAAPTGDGGDGGAAPRPTVIRTSGKSTIEINTTTTRDLIRQFYYEGKDFAVAPGETLGALAALDIMPARSGLLEAIEKVGYGQIYQLEGDPTGIVADRVTEKYITAKKVVIARGDTDYPHHGVDPLAAVAYARALDVPILLTMPGELPTKVSDALESLNTESSVIIGGEAAVSTNVEDQLPSPTRIGGEDRYETSVKVAEALMEETSVDTVVVTNGKSPDHMAAMVAAKYGAPVIYVKGDEIPESVNAFLEENSFERTVLMGVPSGAESKLEELI